MTEFFRHFKGNIYRVLHTAKHSETLEDYTVYQAMYGEKGIWIRPKEMFEETITRDGATLKRFTPLPELERAIEIATQAHQGQKDKAGNDYIGHPLRVMAAGKTPEEQIVGILHDVIEDSDWTFDQLAAEGFSAEILEALKCLTKHPDEPYDKFIRRVKTNPLAIAVKLNDLTDNMDIRRLPYLSDKDIKRLKKYLKAYKQLIGEPTYSIYACQQEHPNAYKPWTPDEDAELTKLWAQGTSITELSVHFQRKEGGIESRLKKLGIIS